MNEGSSYSLAGVDIETAEAAKQDMKSLLTAPVYPVGHIEAGCAAVELRGNVAW